MVHVGVDLHKRVSQIVVLTANGELTHHRLVHEVPRLEQFFAQLPIPSPAAIEATGTWWWLVDLRHEDIKSTVIYTEVTDQAHEAAMLRLPWQLGGRG